MRRSEDDVERFQRLVDQKAFSRPEEAQLRDLVQSSRGVDLSEESKRDVLASVLQRRQVKRSRGSSILRPAVVFTVLLVAAGATAAATLGRRWIARRPPPLPAAPAIEPVAPPPRPAAAPAETTIPEAPVELPAVAEPDNRRQRPSRVRMRSEDPSRVVAALEALRRQHDPERAARLLAEYLAKHPRGALAEEALALSIEAAAARHDPTAGAFAQRYLKEYPTGRFRRTAEAALPRR